MTSIFASKQPYLYRIDTRRVRAEHLLSPKLLNSGLELWASVTTRHGLALDTALPQNGDWGGLNPQLGGSSGDKAHLDLEELDARAGLGGGLLDHGEQAGGRLGVVREDHDDDAVGFVLHDGLHEGFLPVGEISVREAW